MAEITLCRGAEKKASTGACYCLPALMKLHSPDESMRDQALSSLRAAISSCGSMGPQIAPVFPWALSAAFTKIVLSHNFQEFCPSHSASGFLLIYLAFLECILFKNCFPFFKPVCILLLLTLFTLHQFLCCENFTGKFKFFSNHWNSFE